MGFMAAQVVHAAGESAMTRIPPETNAVVLQVPSESELGKIEKKLLEAGVAHVAIREPDAPWCGCLTAIGVLVSDRSLVKPHFGKLPLLGAA